MSGPRAVSTQSANGVCPHRGRERLENAPGGAGIRNSFSPPRNPRQLSSDGFEVLGTTRRHLIAGLPWVREPQRLRRTWDWVEPTLARFGSRGNKCDPWNLLLPRPSLTLVPSGLKLKSCPSAEGRGPDDPPLASRRRDPSGHGGPWGEGPSARRLYADSAPTA
jgi:hypothetical protein